MDFHTTKVAEIDEVELKFTSGNVIILKEVMHTLGIIKMSCLAPITRVLALGLQHEDAT